MATGNTWCKKGMARIKRDAMRFKLGTGKRFKDPVVGKGLKQSAKVAADILARREAREAARRAGLLVVVG